MKHTAFTPNTIYIGAKAVQRLITDFRYIFPEAIEIHNPDAPSPVDNPADEDRYFSAEYLLSDILFTLAEADILRATLEYADDDGKLKSFELNKEGVSGYQGMLRSYKAVKLLMDGAAIVATAITFEKTRKIKTPAKAKRAARTKSGRD